MPEFVVETNRAVPVGTSVESFAWYYLLFMIMGAGANWVFPTALAQEIPYFENHQPEGLCIATYMNATTNFGLFLMGAYVYVHNYVQPIPYYYSVPALLTVSSLGCFFAAAVYPVTAGDASVMLYLCCAVGGSVGALSSVVMNPFMTSFENSYISAARSGGSAFILLTALVASAQSPGASSPRFSVAAYFCIFGALLTLPLLAYRHIIAQKIGLRPRKSPREGEEQGGSGLTLSPLQSAGEGPEGSEHSQGNDQRMGASSSPNSVGSVEQGDNLLGEGGCEGTAPSSLLQLPVLWLQRTLVCDALHKEQPWLRKTLPYMMTVGWVNFNTWGIISAVIPFAMDTASPGDGALNLSVAYQVAAVLLVLGDLSTTLFKLPIAPCLLCFSVFCFTIYAAALRAPGFSSPASAPLLILIFSLERFLEAHVVTSSYRVIATELPLQHRQAASRAVGMSDQGSTTVGALLSTLIVSLLFSCSSS